MQEQGAGSTTAKADGTDARYAAAIETTDAADAWPDEEKWSAGAERRTACKDAYAAGDDAEDDERYDEWRTQSRCSQVFEGSQQNGWAEHQGFGEP